MTTTHGRRPAQQTLVDRQAAIQYKNVAILEEVWLRGDNRNQIAMRDMERYYAMMHRLAGTILSEVGADRMAAIMTSLDGFVATPDSARLAWAHMADNAADAADVALVRSLEPCKLWALLDAAERYNRTTGGAVQDRLAEARIA